MRISLKCLGIPVPYDLWFNDCVILILCVFLTVNFYFTYSKVLKFCYFIKGVILVMRLKSRLLSWYLGFWDDI